MKTTTQQQAEHTVIDAWTLFQVALSKRGAYPTTELNLLFECVVNYSEQMADSEFIHKSIAGMFKGFREFLVLERKRVPGSALATADRLETILFDGYDPQFEGDEPDDL
jgi:hypothetical protein